MTLGNGGSFDQSWRMGKGWEDELGEGTSLGGSEEAKEIRKAVKGTGKGRQVSADDYTVAREVLYLLPDTFLTYYQALFHGALKTGIGGVGARDEAQSEVGKAAGSNTKGRTLGTRLTIADRHGNEVTPEVGMQKALGRKKKSSSAYSSAGFGIHSERLLAEKDRIDRALRKLARQMRNTLEDSQGASGSLGKRCGQDDKGHRIRVLVNDKKNGKQMRPGGCWKFVEKEWAYCPFCGFKLR